MMSQFCISSGVLVIAMPYASGFDYFFIADEVQFKFDRCFRFLRETVSTIVFFILSFLFFIFKLKQNSRYLMLQVSDLPTFGIGHSWDMSSTY